MVVADTPHWQPLAQHPNSAVAPLPLAQHPNIAVVRKLPQHYCTHARQIHISRERQTKKQMDVAIT